MRNTERNIVGVLHNIRSTHNVGSMFRTADAAGVSHLYLVGYTPTPVDRFGRQRKDVAKIALGGEQHVPWSSHEDLRTLLETLRKEGFVIVFFESGDARSVFYDDIFFGDKVACVVGNEVEGLPLELKTPDDLCAEIPLFGTKESLNVSVAFGVAVYRARCTP